MPRRKSGDSRNGIPNPFNPQDPDWRPTASPAPKPASVYRSAATKKIMASSAATGGKAGRKRRAGSVGVSSSSRQRTHKRGPQNRRGR